MYLHGSEKQPLYIISCFFFQPSSLVFTGLSWMNSIPHREISPIWIQRKCKSISYFSLRIDISFETMAEDWLVVPCLTRLDD